MPESGAFFLLAFVGLVVMVLLVLLQLTRLGYLIRTTIPDRPRQRMFIASVSFLITFAGVRILVHRIANHEGHMQWVVVRGMHIHHLVWGILILLLVGYGWLLDLGWSNSPMSIFFGRLMAVSYGVGAALTLDEFALVAEPGAGCLLDTRRPAEHRRGDDLWRGAGGGSVGRAVFRRAASGCGASTGRCDRASAGSARRFAARGCFVGVKFGDRRRISRSENATLDLHRGRELSGVLRPLFGDDAEALEGFKVGQGAVHLADNFGVERDDARDRPQAPRGTGPGCRDGWPTLQGRRSWARSGRR